MPRVDCSHRVGYNSVPYRFTSIRPIPHTLFFLPCLLSPLPVPKHSGRTGCTGCNRFPLYILFFSRFFSLPPHFISIFPLFSTFGGKSIESIASIANHCVLNLNLTDGSKTNLWKKYSKQSAIYCSWYTPETVGTGWCNS